MAFKMFPPAPMTAQGISTQRQIANALLQQGMDTSPVGHWSQGAARVAQALLGGYKGQQAEQAAAELQRKQELEAATEKAKAEAEKRNTPEFKFGPDGSLYNWNPYMAEGGKPLLLSQATQKAEEIKKLNDSMLYKPDGKGGVEWITPPGASANAGNPYADEYAKQYAKDSAKKNAEIGRSITEGGMDARAQLENLNRVGDYLNDDDVYQGPGAETSLPVRRLLSYVPGLNQLKGLSPDAIAKSDAAIGISNEMALMIRNPDAGLGMPGALSDADRVFLRETVPGLSKSFAGNKLMIEAAKRLNKRKVEIAEFKAEYVQENGQIDDRFFEIVSKWANDPKNALFDDIGNLPNMPKIAKKVSTAEDYNALEPGAFYTDPDGNIRQKPGAQ